MAQRAGRGNSPSGIDGSEKGEMAVECTMCPVHGRNVSLVLEKDKEEP
jgi:hypothetical protein